MMRRLIACLSAIAFLTGCATASEIAVSKFKYLNSNESSVIIDQEDAQDILNCDVTAGGKSVKKRPGYGLYKTAFTPSTGVHGGYHFFDATGNDVQVWGSSVSVKGIVNDGTPTTIVSSMTVNATLDCADTQGSAYCVSSSHDFYIRTNGATLTNWYLTPAGTMVEATPDRIVVAGVQATPNTLFISQANTFTNFTPGPLTTDPFTEVIASPGSKLTHIRWGCGKLLWWKDQSFGYFAFDDQYSAQVKIVSDNIGTFDNTSAIDPGGSVWFRGQDGHTYTYDCSWLTKQTIDITPQIQTSGHRTSNSWVQTTQADFQTGYSVGTDTAASPGDVLLNGFSDDFVNISSWSVVFGSWAVTSGVAVSSTNVSYSSSAMITNGTLSLSPTNYYLEASFKFPVDSSRPLFYICAVDASYNGYCARQSPNGAGKYITQIVSMTGMNTFVTLGQSPAGASVDSGYHFISLQRLSNGAMTAYFDGTLQVTQTDNANSQTPTKIYAMSNSAVVGGGIDTTIDYLRVYPTTGTYYSAVHNDPNLGSWSTFNPNAITNNGTISYFVRASTGAFTILSSTPNWVVQTPGAVVNYSTGTYFQTRVDFAIVTATQTPTLNDFTFNWFDGTASDQAYFLYFDNSIWESVTYGVGISTNNYIFKNDLINQGWTLYSFGAGGMLIQNNHLFFGDANNGSIYQYGTGTSDNGSAINGYWRSKSFTGQDPFIENQLTQLDVYAKKDQGQTLSVTYTLNQSTSTTYNIGTSSTTQTVIQSRKLLPSGKNGYTCDFKFSDTTATSSFEVFGFRVGYNPQPYRPSTP